MISLNDEHPLKTLDPIEATEEGIMIRRNDEHFLKAELSIEVIEIDI